MTILASRLLLRCRYEGIPTPQVLWYVTPSSTGVERQLGNTGRFSITRSVINDGTVFSVIQISDLQKSDNGSYRCMGSNGVVNLIGAVDSYEFFVTIYGKGTQNNLYTYSQLILIVSTTCIKI